MITSPNTPLVYIGSTTQLLSKRFGSHTKGNKTNSKIVLEYGDACIQLVEEYPCENKKQLNKREGEIIKNRECVNKQISGRTKEEWYKDNIERLLEKARKYQQEHREEKKEYLKHYYLKNKEKARKYREENREKINSQLKERRRNKNKNLHQKI